VGLNLTAASHVIHFDRWWNPAVENQATDRAYRIGQKKNVMVHKFMCKGTIEEKIDRLIKDKLKLATAIIEDSEALSLTEMNDEALMDLVMLNVETVQNDEEILA
jgi:non-specific serine/threonine protein kinase